MYLQALEVIGFKSFAQKTVLNFHPGVTAIVGPNGCGKSNVLDAIRWVLGEQSAKALRGGEMADVIFSGTDSCPALGMAEVSLTFADCEKELGVAWNEVRITRRVFRDGNSEYFLNKTPCRLKDIHQLFMDTGIGRSAYSIMEQGKIDLILSSKPEDRRAIFEEAAGITKFKAQRREALRKLEATEANLLRVGDIIKEVKRQIGSLQRQAGKARRYQALVADLKTLDTHASKRQFDALEADLCATQAEIERLRESQDKQQAEIDGHEADLAAQRRQLDEMEQALGAARQVVNDLKNHIANAENRIGFNRERAHEFAGLMDRYQRDIAAAEEKLQVQETQIRDTDLELEQIASTLEFEQGRLNEKMQATNAVSARRVEVEKSLQALFGSVNAVERRLSALRGEMTTLISQRDGSEARLGILKNEIDQLDAASGSLESQQADLAAQIESASAALAAAQTSAHDAEEAVLAAESDLDASESDLVAEQRKLAERESKLEVLRQLNEAGEGFGEGTQAVLRGLDNPEFFKPAIAGALAAHIEVEPQFVPAIEAALGHNLQAVILKDTMMAEHIVKTLVSKKMGRASLALRDCGLRIADRGSADALPEGAIARAVEKVKTDETAGDLIRALLRDFVIVQDVEAALRLASNPQSAIRNSQFVTLTGEVLSREGILTGGQPGKVATSVLQRKNQISALEKESTAIRKAISKSETRRDEAAEQLEAARARAGELRDEVQNANVTISTLRSELSLIERDARDTSNKLNNLRWERGNIEKRHTEAVDKLGALESESVELTDRVNASQSQQHELQSQLETLRAREGELGAELNEMRIRVATEKQRHASLANQRAPMTARLAELDELIEHRRRDIEGYQTKSAALADENARIQGEIEMTRGRVAEAEQNVAQLADQRGTMVSAAESAESTLRILRRQLGDCHERRGHEEVTVTQVQLRIENLCERISRKYQIDLREFQADSYALNVTLREVGKRQRKLEASASETGEIAAETGAVEAAADADRERVEQEQEKEKEKAAERAEGIDWDRVEALVKEMEQRLDSMGPINVDAIQEYDELEERHKFLEQQFNDLTTSKAELLDVIAKINRTTRVLFAETFERICVNFREMFVELFGGGKANLMLLDESDPLESGIEIIAKPPGKQLQSISLLSGGEKTMTAVALLFSIYMVKPSPFCVLDEMDAPLDESNINRFIKILDRFVEQSQFVVITHNKRTIAKADVLYGVTMEEHGVSKLVGVKFAKREESHERSDIIGTANVAPVPSIAETFGKSDELHSEKLQAG
jgi:chromosome segregation protein